MFLDPNEFEFISMLETNWQVIKQELDQLQQQHFIPWSEQFLYGQGWDVFGLYAYRQKLVYNCSLCPETTRLVEAIPGMTTAGFSSLAPGTHIQPHVGYSNTVLRCHLGLSVPDGCALRVGTQTHSWQNGKCLLFDDTTEHEAWNYGNASRVVLLIDLQRPGVKFQTSLPVQVSAAIASVIRADSTKLT